MEDYTKQREELKQYVASLELELTEFANKHGVDKVRLESSNYKREFAVDENGRMSLVKQRAVIWVNGRGSIVLLGKETGLLSYDEAVAFEKRRWADYARKRRANMTPEEREREREYQKQYHQSYQPKRRERAREARRLERRDWGE